MILEQIPVSPRTFNAEFTEFPKMARLSRDCVISEKIDGTNAQVYIEELPDDTVMPTHTPIVAVAGKLLIYAGSRSRLITPEDDNFGFARWVKDNAEQLALLGPGRHFGEWWGSGIQRGYGLPKGEKRFSLFAIDRYKDSPLEKVPGLAVVPELYRGEFDTMIIKSKLRLLDVLGSKAAPGYDNPEGLIIYHEASREVFKLTFDDTPKGNQE
ncbi:MAG: RNA ligase family protein [Armatimonadota bacterium]